MPQKHLEPPRGSPNRCRDSYRHARDLRTRNSLGLPLRNTRSSSGHAELQIDGVPATIDRANHRVSIDLGGNLTGIVEKLSTRLCAR